MDRLEQHLRDVLSDQRHALPADRVSIDSVRAGAARRRHRRNAVAAASTVAVLALVAIPVGLQLTRNPPDLVNDVAALKSTSSPGPTSSTETATSSPSATSLPKNPLLLPWDDAWVRSVTATSTGTFVVLGATKACNARVSCIRLAESHDGGHSFNALPIPDPSTGIHFGGDDPTPHSILDVRFGSANDGWLFGDGLWATHDGGESWARITMPGRVAYVEAAAGRAWALATPSLDASDYALWSTQVGSDDWRREPGVTIREPAELAVRGKQVVVAGPARLWTGTAGEFTSHPSICPTSNFVGLSSSSSLWAACRTGTAAHLRTSIDGVTWTTVVTSEADGSLPNSVAVGARSTDDAIVSVGPSQPVFALRADGTKGTLSRPPAAQSGRSIFYIGFTTDDVGYAVDGRYLYRTENGGDTWRALAIG